jgi:prevent-host-death family protein
METIGALEAESRLGELLDKVERGESVTITRDGRAVAQLVPSPLREDNRNRADVIRDLLDFGKGRRLQGIGIREMIEEGRRFWRRSRSMRATSSNGGPPACRSRA